MDDHQLPPASKELGPHKGGEAYLGYAEAGRYVYEQHEAREPGGFLEYWRLLCRYKVIIVGMTVLGAVAGILLTLTQQPVYQARAAIEIQNINEDFLNIKQVSPVSKGDNSTVLTEIQTQMRLLQSESLIKRVLTKLKDRTFEEPQVSTIRLFVWRKALHLPEATLRDEPDPDAAAGSLKVRASGPTRVVEISYDSKNPHFAAAFVNTLVQESIESTMEARLKGSAYTSEWLSRELEDMRIKLQPSEDALQSYARRAGLMFTSEKTNISEEKLRQLQEQLSRTQADRIAAQSRWEITKISPPDALPDVLNDSLLRSLQEKLTELRRQQAELITIYTENHNKVKQVEAQIAPLEAALQRERSAIIERLRNDYEAALRRERLLAADFAKQSGLVTDEAEKSIQYGILKREVDSNREIYASMLQRVKEARIASAVRASNIRIIDAAEPPEYPYKPSLPINGALGLFSGLCIGAAVAIMRGRADRTLQAPGEARFWLKVPELQVIPAAPRTLRRRLLPSLMAESFRSLLTSILFSGDDGESPQALVLRKCRRSALFRRPFRTASGIQNRVRLRYHRHTTHVPNAGCESTGPSGGRGNPRYTSRPHHQTSCGRRLSAPHRR